MFFLFKFIYNIMFIVIIIIFLSAIIRGITIWNKNNKSPRLTVDASVISKRRDKKYHHHGNNHMQNYHTTSSTSYYVTFQVDSGDRIEFRIKGSEYGLLIEGDYGKLFFQGSRYLNFEKEII